MQYSEFFDRLKDADKVLIGIGEGFPKDRETALLSYNYLAEILSGKDYFIVELSEESFIKESNIDINYVALPMDEHISKEDGEKKWNDYTMWLQHTLNKNLLLIELGVGFGAPTVIRWPFEKVTMLNNKAFLYRVNEKFPQLSEEIKGKGKSIKASVGEFITSLIEER